jgi:hypothetical protein
MFNSKQKEWSGKLVKVHTFTIKMKFDCVFYVYKPVNEGNLNWLTCPDSSKWAMAM